MVNWNPFLLAAAILMAGGSVWGYAHGDWKTATVYLMYAIANVLLASVKG